MKVSDIELEKIEKLLNSVPEGLEVISLDFSNGYELKLSATFIEGSDKEYKASIDKLMKILKEFDKG